MKRPLVFPAEETGDAELQKLIEFYNETLGFCPNSIKTMYHRPDIAYSFIAMNRVLCYTNIPCWFNFIDYKPA